MKYGFIKLLSFSGLSLIFFTLAISVFLFFIGLPVGALNFLAANIVSMILTSFVFKDFKRVFCAHFVNFIIINILAVYFSTTKDFTADSLWYHIPAIDLIRSGWNPADINTAHYPLHDWGKYFTKGPWIINAAFAVFYSCLEAAKLLGSFLIYLSCLFSYMALSAFIKNNKVVCIILALGAGFNTVSMVQSFTFLVDGCLSSTIAIFISSIALYYKTNDKIFLYTLFFALCLLVNCKLSAFAYAFVFIIASLYFIRKDIKYYSMLIFAIVFTLFVIGFNPYTINLIKHNNPFYPIGSKDVKIVENSAPKAIWDKFYINKFLISLFSKSCSVDETPEFKIPFSVTKREIERVGSPQPLLDGFGFLFSGVLLSAIFMIALSYKKRGYRDFLIVEGTLLASVLINPECWWARFVPQFYFFNIVAACFLFAGENSLLERKYKILGYILTFAIFANTVITGFFYFKKVLECQRMQNELTYILQRYPGKIYIDSQDARIEGIRIKLKNSNIKYREHKGNACEGQKIRYATIELCLIPQT